jgi:membrane dipeptidase
MSASIQPGQFDFNLNAEQEARAARLHRESIIFDLVSQHAGGAIFSHYPAQLQADLKTRIAAANSDFDALAEAEYWPYEMARLGKSDLIWQWLKEAGLTCGTYAIGVHDGADTLCNMLEAQAERYRELPWLRYVTSAAEIRQAKREDSIAFYAQWQPFNSIPRDLKAVDTAYRKGLRSLMLTYNVMDHVGVGYSERVDAGLSMFGLGVVKHCNDLGLMIDLSHCGHLTTMDACRHSKKPVTANHTSAKGVYAHQRAKTDDALHAIADTDGVIGVVATPSFLTRAQAPTIEDMLDHIDYISDLVGWRHVAIGTDWPMQITDELIEKVFMPLAKSAGLSDENPYDPTKRLIGFNDCRDLPNITRGLVGRGYNDEQIRGIIGENALRVFAEACGA